MGDRIAGIELAVAEIAVQRAVKLVAARLGLHIHLNARRPSQRGVEPVGDDLELVDGVLAVLRLAETVSRRVLGDLLAVHVDLQLAAIRGAERRIGDVIARDAGHHHRQLEIVASVQRDTADFRRTDVARNGGGAGIDGCGCGFHGNGGTRRCQLQRHVDGGNLPHKHGQSTLGRNESRDLKAEDVFAGAHRGYLIHALSVGLRREFCSILGGRSDHDIRHDSVRRIGQPPSNAGLLRQSRRGSQREDKYQSPHRTALPRSHASVSTGIRESAWSPR